MSAVGQREPGFPMGGRIGERRISIFCLIRPPYLSRSAVVAAWSGRVPPNGREHAEPGVWTTTDPRRGDGDGDGVLGQRCRAGSTQPSAATW